MAYIINPILLAVIITMMVLLVPGRLTMHGIPIEYTQAPHPFTSSTINSVVLTVVKCYKSITI